MNNRSGCTGPAPTLSAACTGTIGPLAPGATKVASGCTATFAPGSTGNEWLFTLMVIHCGADGGPPCTTNWRRGLGGGGAPAPAPPPYPSLAQKPTG